MFHRHLSIILVIFLSLLCQSCGTQRDLDQGDLDYRGCIADPEDGFWTLMDSLGLNCGGEPGRDGLWTDIDSVGTLIVSEYVDGQIIKEYFRMDYASFGKESKDPQFPYNKKSHGRKNGIWIELSKGRRDGDAIEIIKYKNGKRNGFYIKLGFPQNQMEEKGDYRNGKRNGWFTYYLMNGSAMSKVLYRDGKEIRRAHCNPRYF